VYGPAVSFLVWSGGQISDSAGPRAKPGKIAPQGRFFGGDDVAFKNAIFMKRILSSPENEPSSDAFQIVRNT
jgi:hypothetical protein